MTSDDRRHGRRLIAGVVAAGVAAGCFAPARITSTGSVRYAGQPVETGAIVFRPLDRGAAPEAAAIKGGRFTISGLPGKRRVEIRGTRAVDPAAIPRTMPRLADAPVHEDYIPALYNAASTLEVEVKAGGPNVFDFDLAAPP